MFKSLRLVLALFLSALALPFIVSSSASAAAKPSCVVSLSPTATETLYDFTQRLQGMGDAALMAMKQLSQIVHRQAVVMGYGDAFFMLTLFYVGLSLLVMLLKKPNPAATAGGGH